MQLHHLLISNYKNIAETDLSLSPSVNCFVGKNGMGKTNLLDAVYYLSFCKSYTGAPEEFNIRHDAPFFSLRGDYRDELEADLSVTCSVERGRRKKVRCNGKDYGKFSAHVGRIPLVMISPADSRIVSGGSEERRRFMDVVISQYDSHYLECAIRYERQLKQRGAMLKAETAPDPAVMDVVEEMLSADATVIHAARRAFIEAFTPIFRDIYTRLSGVSDERPDIVYVSHLDRGPLKAQLEDWRERERIVGYTLHGTHKDELELTIRQGYALKREGSQGQTKTFFIAMKLAQYVFLRGMGEKRTPILLLDDIFDKLDANRVTNIVDYVSTEAFGQTFITDTNREHIDAILAAMSRPYRLFIVEDGQITLSHGA